MLIYLVVIVVAISIIVIFTEKDKDDTQKKPKLTSVEKNALSVFEQKVNEFLSDGIIDRKEERELMMLVEELQLSDAVLQECEPYVKLMQSLVLRDIEEGRDFERVHVENLSILLSKNERLLWAYSNIEGYERKTGSRYTAGSNGVSLKICKGVYYRVGASKGYSQPYEYQKHLGNGEFIITNKGIYFVGDNHAKLLFSKILSFEPYSDGITIVKDGASPKPYTFVGFDPWFLINAMQLLAD